MTKIWWLGILALAVVALSALGQRESMREAKPSPPEYRVTPWPVEDPERDDTREVEAHLNRMAAEGWRFHGQLTAHRAQMLVFERAGSARDRSDPGATVGSD